MRTLVTVMTLFSHNNFAVLNVRNERYVIISCIAMLLSNIFNCLEINFFMDFWYIRVYHRMFLEN